MKKASTLLAGALAVVATVWFLSNGKPAPSDRPITTFQRSLPVKEANVSATTRLEPTVPQPPEEASNLTGRVLSMQTGEGVEGVSIVIEREHGSAERLEMKTDSAGAFGTVVQGPGEYRLIATHPSLVSEQWSYLVEVAENATAADVEIWMQRGGEISGRVYDAVTDRGIAGVTIGVEREKVPGTKTGEDGQYRITGVRGGETQIFLSHARGYIDSHTTDENGMAVSVSLGEEISGVDFALQPGVFAAITGKVVDENGQAVAGAEITAVARDARTNNGQQRSGSSKDDGTFTIDELQVADGFYVSARTEGHASDELGPLGLGAQGIHKLVLTLWQTGSISGRVSDEHTGKPVTDPDLIVDTTYRSFGARYIGGRSGKLDANGNFTIEKLPSGSYGLFVDIIEWRSTGITVPQLTLDLQRGQDLTNVQLKFDYDGYLRSKAQIAAALSAQSKKDDSDDPHVGLVRGQVVSADTGDPVTTFYLQANHTWMGSSRTRRTVHDPEGRFTLEENKGETLSLKISSKGFAPKQETLRGGRGPQAPQDITVRLQPGTVVDGEVTDPRGDPVAGAEIYVGVNPREMGHDEWEIQSDAISQPDGSFRLDSLPETPVRVYAVHPTFSIGSAEVRASRPGPTRLRIVLSGGAGFEGVVCRSGSAMPGQFIGVLNEAGKNVQVARDSTDGQGRYKIDRLPSGRYTFYTGVDGHSWSIHREADAVDGLLTVLDFDFDETENMLEGRVTVNGVQPLSASIRAEVATATGLHRFRPEGSQTGEYTMYNLPLGEAKVSVFARHADGFDVTESFTVPVTGGRIERDFHLVARP